jgi:hypothetical protein
MADGAIPRTDGAGQAARCKLLLVQRCFDSLKGEFASGSDALRSEAED